MNLEWAILTVAAMGSVGFGILILRLFRQSGTEERGAEWLSDFSIDNYRPLERLLRESDYEFLAAQPGFHPHIAWELRAERRRIFHGYLGAMIGDFRTLTRMARLLAVHSSEDRSDFLRAIFWMRMRFYFLVAGVEVRMALAPLPVGRIDIPGLIGQLAVLRENLDDLSLSRHPA